MEKAKGSLRSISRLRSSLYDSIDEMCKLAAALNMDGEVSIKGYLGSGASLESTVLQLLDIKELLRERKEAIPKGRNR